MTGQPSLVGNCEKCGADFDGGPIPEEIRHNYSPPYRWSRRIGIVWNDRVQKWKCPDCGNEVPRDR